MQAFWPALHCTPAIMRAGMHTGKARGQQQVRQARCGLCISRAALIMTTWLEIWWSAVQRAAYRYDYYVSLPCVVRCTLQSSTNATVRYTPSCTGLCYVYTMYACSALVLAGAH